ncbi:MAG TPA: ribosome silencing factor [Exilispira sp.]|nr:ribosome silencing factor [Exilispira sp.]
MQQEKEIAKIIVEILNEKKVEDIVIVDIAHVLPIADYFIIGTVATSHQIASIVKEIEEKIKPYGLKQINRSAVEQSGWFLLDFNIVIVHLFIPETREYYQLENLWKKYIVDIKELG